MLILLRTRDLFQLCSRDQLCLHSTLTNSHRRLSLSLTHLHRTPEAGRMEAWSGIMRISMNVSSREQTRRSMQRYIAWWELCRRPYYA